MRNKEYWEACLSEVLPYVTDDIVRGIMQIAEMEYEYTNAVNQAIYLVKEDAEKTHLQRENNVLKTEFAKFLKADSVHVEGNRVIKYNK